MDEKEVTTSSPSDETDVELETDPSSEESESNVNKKSAEARINELISQVKRQEELITDLQKKTAPPPPPPRKNEELDEEAKKASEYLRNLGFVTEDKLKESTQSIQDRYMLDSEHMRLEGRYDGSDGRPKYDRQKIEEFMRKRGIYDLEAAYDTLYKTELLDWEIKQLESKNKKKPYIARGGSTGGTSTEQTITREKITEWMKTPEGREEYERNRSKVLELMQKGQL